jgi:predicted Zn-dependent peptidase
MGTNVDYGVFVMYTQTKSEATLLALEKIRKVFSDFVTQRQLLADELKVAQKREINKMIFQFEVPFVTVYSKLEHDYYGFPKDYVAVYQKEIEKITLDRLFDVMPKYFFPDQLQIVIVGDKTKIPGLETLPGLVEKPLDSE